MYLDNLDGLEIRMAAHEESSKIINMLKEIARWMKENDINQWRFLLEGGDDEEIEHAIANNETYIVLKDNELVATFTLTSNQSEWDTHIWGEDFSSNSLYLHRLAIDPAYMKKGLGSGILNWIQTNISNEKEYLKLNCVGDNLKLNNFYKNNNFELVGITDGHSKFQKRMKSQW